MGRKQLTPARFHDLHESGVPGDGVELWLRFNIHRIPEDAQPPPGEMRGFVNYLDSYLTTSFDLLDDPGTRLASIGTCDCSLCTYAARRPYLQAKKPRQSDKDRATRACRERLAELAREEGLELPEARTEEIMASSQARRDSAYSAYGTALLERVRGGDSGPYVLVLWRMIAWKPEGSPIPGFTLEPEDIFAAEQRLREALRGVYAPPA